MCVVCDIGEALISRCEADMLKALNLLWKDVNKAKPEALNVLRELRNMFGDKPLLAKSRLANRWAKLDEGMKFRSFYERWNEEQIKAACDGVMMPEASLVVR